MCVLVDWKRSPTCSLAADEISCSEKDKGTQVGVKKNNNQKLQPNVPHGSSGTSTPGCSALRTFMKFRLPDRWKNICKERRSFSASRRFSFSSSAGWAVLRTHAANASPSICAVSAWSASSSACILWYWALARSFSSDTVACAEKPRGRQDAT